MKRLACLLSLFFLPGLNARSQVVGGAVTGTSLNVSTLSTGTVLQVTPAVTADRRYVGMAIHPQFSTLEGVDTFVLDGLLGTAGNVGGQVPRAVAVTRIPFRSAVVANVTFVDNDKPLLAAAIKPLEIKGAELLKVAIRKLSDATKRNLVLGDRGLEQAGADLNATHDFLLKPADSKKPLTMKDALLSLVQTAVPETDLVITSEDKVITIVTQAQGDQALITRTYFLADILANMPRFVAGGTDLNKIGPAARAPAPPPATEQAGPVKSGKPTKAAKPNNSTSVLDVITSTVRPEIWKNNGGKSEIYLVNDRVTIKAPASVHALFDGPKTHNPNKVNPYVTYGQ